MITTLDLICFSDKLRDVEQKIFTGKENRTEILPLSLIAEKQDIKLPDILQNEPFYLISKNDDKYFSSSFRVYATDDNTLAVCNCFNMPVTGVSIDNLMIGSNYQLQSYAKCFIDGMTTLIPIRHTSLNNFNFDFGDNQYAEILPADVPDGFIRGIGRLYYVPENLLPVNKKFSIQKILRENHQILLSCLCDGCCWLVYINNLTEYMQKKDQIKSFVRVKAKRAGRFAIIYQ